MDCQHLSATILSLEITWDQDPKTHHLNPIRERFPRGLYAPVSLELRSSTALFVANASDEEAGGFFCNFALNAYRS